MLADTVLTEPVAGSEPNSPPEPLEPLAPDAWAFAEQSSSSTAVWVPFHSQMSAEGFATRLGRELGHEFRVEKRGAGSYEVVFDAVDPIQQALLEARVREITGQ